MNTIELIRYLEDSFPITTSIDSENARTIFLAGYEIRDKLATLYFISIARKGIIDTIIITFFVGNTDNLDKIRSKIISEILDKLKKKVHIPNSFIFELVDYCKVKKIEIESILKNRFEEYTIRFRRYVPEIVISRENSDTVYIMNVKHIGWKITYHDSLDSLKSAFIDFVNKLVEGDVKC